MKKKKRMGGIIRLVILIIVLAAAMAGIRLAAGRFASGRAKKEAAEQASRVETGSAAGSTAQEKADLHPLPAQGEDGEQSALTGSPASGDPVEESSADSLSSDGLSADAGKEPAAAEGATAAAAESEGEEPVFDHVTTELEKGRAFLASLDARTPVEMEYMISEARKEHEKELEKEAWEVEERWE